MNLHTKEYRLAKAGILSFLMTLLCFVFCLTAGAALSTEYILTASDGDFVYSGGKWTYQYEDGTCAKDCLLNIDGKTYYFSKNGYRQSGWKKIDGNYYYFGSSSEGYMYKLKWLKKNGNYYFLKSSGKRAEGWMTWAGKTYYFDQDGKRLSGWQTINKKKYYLGTASEGYRYQNTWLTYKNKLYYLQAKGVAATGWKTINGQKYYFGKNGCAFTGRKKIGGTYYNFSQKGVLLSSGANLTLSSDCAILINANTGVVLYEKNADTKHANASTTKILTCILALEQCSLTETVTVSANAAAQEPTKLYMRTGDSFRLGDLLYSLMLPSHNDTAVAIAEHISGSTSKFASLMNQKAREIGCTSTNFVTPNGLDNGLNHYTTARDLAKIAQYALKNSTLRKIVNTSSYTFKSSQGTVYQVSTTNELLGDMTGVSGMKTGFTNKAGYCFVGTVKAKNGQTYISVTLGGSTSTARWTDSRKLLQFAYNRS